MKASYTIAYLWNDQTYVETFDSFEKATIRYWKLKSEGKEPSLHFDGEPW